MDDEDEFPPKAALAEAPVSAEPVDDDDEFPPEAALAGAPISAEPVDDEDEFPPEVALAGAPISPEPVDDEDEFPPDESLTGIDAGAPLASSIRVAEHEFPPVDAYEPFDEVPPFDAFEPFDDVPLEPVARGRGRVRVRRSRRTSPVTLLLAAIGLITVLSCGLCIVASALSFPAIQRIVGEVIQTVTYEPGFATLVSFATPAPGASSALNDPLPTDLNQRGNANVGQTLRASVNTFTDDAWTLNGEANQRVIIELNATDDTLDPQLYLYDPDNREIAANDDIGSGNNNARIAITLPYSGAYTIRISAFGTGGGYELTVRQG